MSENPSSTPSHHVLLHESGKMIWRMQIIHGVDEPQSLMHLSSPLFSLSFHKDLKSTEVFRMWTKYSLDPIFPSSEPFLPLHSLSYVVLTASPPSHSSTHAHLSALPKTSLKILLRRTWLHSLWEVLRKNFCSYLTRPLRNIWLPHYSLHKTIIFLTPMTPHSPRQQE